MKNLESALNELKQYVGKTDEESRVKFNDILSTLESMNLTDGEQVVLNEFMCTGLSEINAGIDRIENEFRIREQLKEATEILPLSYIAKHYFGKSASWLYQRINGNKVRGKVYTLNVDEVATFNKALKEIGNKISSLSITC